MWPALYSIKPENAYASLVVVRPVAVLTVERERNEQVTIPVVVCMSECLCVLSQEKNTNGTMS